MFTNAGPNVGRKPAQIAKNEPLHYKRPSLNTTSIAHPSHWQHKIRGTYTVMNNQFTTCKLYHVREHTYIYAGACHMTPQVTCVSCDHTPHLPFSPGTDISDILMNVVPMKSSLLTLSLWQQDRGQK